MISKKKFPNKFFFHIDVVGVCNLECPSCPVGNSPEVQNPRGMMAPALLENIMNKAVNECVVQGVNLFNWTEPLIHPKIDHLVRIVQSFGVKCDLSSNLNVLKHPEKLLLANPASFRVSLSGFSQPVYGQTHRGGDIEKVKRNMVLLAEAKQKTGSTTKLHVLYHRYTHNLHEEQLAKDFSTNLGFEFVPVWAFMMPLEKSLAYLEGDPGKVLTQDDQQIIENLALPLRQASAAAMKYNEQPCQLLEKQISLDWRGYVSLCCGVYDLNKYGIGNYLETPMEQLQDARRSHTMCNRCTRHGMHVYAVYGAPEFESIAQNHVKDHHLGEMEPTAGLAQLTRKQRKPSFLRRMFEQNFRRSGS